MHKVHQIDRDAAADMQRYRAHNKPTGAEEAMRVGLVDDNHTVQAFAAYRIALAECILTDPNIATALQARMCCNGVDCGCHGATVEQYLRYILTE